MISMYGYRGGRCSRKYDVCQGCRTYISNPQKKTFAHGGNVKINSRCIARKKNQNRMGGSAEDDEAGAEAVGPGVGVDEHALHGPVVGAGRGGGGRSSAAGNQRSMEMASSSPPPPPSETLVALDGSVVGVIEEGGRIPPPPYPTGQNKSGRVRPVAWQGRASWGKGGMIVGMGYQRGDARIM